MAFAAHIGGSLFCVSSISTCSLSSQRAPLLPSSFLLPAGGETLGLLQRLDDIRVEALVALDRVQHSRPAGSSSAVSLSGSSGSSSGGGVLDYELELDEHDAAVKAFR